MSRSWRVACAVSALTAALYAAGAPAPASAEEVAFKPKAAGDINIRLRGIGVVPTERGDIKNATTGGDTTLNVRLGNAYVPEVDVSYFLTPNIALELIAATTKHDVDASPAGLDLGSVWLLPPTLTLQYHFAPTSRFSPYVGAGLNYTIFYNEKKGCAELDQLRRQHRLRSAGRYRLRHRRRMVVQHRRQEAVAEHRRQGQSGRHRSEGRRGHQPLDLRRRPRLPLLIHSSSPAGKKQTRRTLSAAFSFVPTGRQNNTNGTNH